MTAEDGLKKALQLAGSQTKLAHMLGLRPQAVQHWKRVPIKKAIKVSRLLGIPMNELVPELFDESGSIENIDLNAQHPKVSKTNPIAPTSTIHIPRRSTRPFKEISVFGNISRRAP